MVKWIWPKGDIKIISCDIKKMSSDILKFTEDPLIDESIEQYEYYKYQ